MNARDVLKYGHNDVVKSVEGLSDTLWEEIGVTPLWSIKDHIGHLAAFEHVMGDVLQSVSVPTAPTPYLEKYRAAHDSFNDSEAAARKSRSHAEVLQEYVEAALRTQKLAESIPPDTFAKNGILPWYGADYALDDYIVYANYGHKQGHVTQIRDFRERRNTI